MVQMLDIMVVSVDLAEVVLDIVMERGDMVA